MTRSIKPEQTGSTLLASIARSTKAFHIQHRRQPFATAIRSTVLGAMLPISLMATSVGVAQASECANEALRLNPAVSNVDTATGQPLDANLPDCRAYEQVSPSEKDGGSGGVFYFNSSTQAGQRLPMQSLSDGEAITYPGGPFFGVETKNPSELNSLEQYTSTRSTSGWTTQNHDLLALEHVPVPPLPPLTDTNGYQVNQSQVLEETPDGSKVFFLDERDLIPGKSNPAPEEPDLYEYDVVSKQLTDLTVDPNPTGHADARGILGIGGEDGSYVYFVAGGLLAQGASKSGCTDAVPGNSGDGAAGEGCNLYLRHNGVTSFIETLPAEDEEGPILTGVVMLDWPLLPSQRTAEVSPSGRFLTFGSRAPAFGAGNAEIFRFDAAAAEEHKASVVCVTCSPAGGEALLPPSDNTAINGANRQRYVLDDGRVLFTTTQQLVPQDVNHQPDVYEWENGSPRLISAGTSESDQSIFTDASSTGNDIFFTTADSLTPSDQDGITDLYDAREGGGFPPPPEPACAPEAQCPVGLVGSPVPPTPSSLVNTALEPPGPSTNAPSPTPKPTKAQLLAKALRTCRSDHKRAKRLACEKQARTKYAPKKRSKSKKTGGK
jgi:hypothetical protein